MNKIIVNACLASCLSLNLALGFTFNGVMAAQLRRNALPSEESLPADANRGPKVITNPTPTRSSPSNATEVKDPGPIIEEEMEQTKEEEAGNSPSKENLKLITTTPGSNAFRLKKLPDRKTMALALGGGGARGAAHIGVLRVFEQEKIPIDYIIGNSMGAVVGGLYCAGVDLDSLEQRGKDGTLRKAYLPKMLSILMIPVSRFIPSKNKYAGISSGNGYEKKLTKVIPEECISFENLKIPFSAVATNLIDGNAYRISEGNLAKAIRASSTISPLLKPVKIGNGLYVDGGVRANLPASAARDTGADVVIAILVDEPLRELPEKTFRSYKNVASRLADVVLAVTDEHQLQFADIIINPDVSGIPILSKKKSDVEKAVAAGEEAARKAIPLIRKKMGLTNPDELRVVKGELPKN